MLSVVTEAGTRVGGTRFEGRIGRDWRDSEPWWPPETLPPPGAPNVVLVVLDDVGFAQLGCFGSDLKSPTLDGLAERGVRLTNFRTTALCSPTRACLLTGRNHHRNGMGRIADLAMGFPGYTGRIPRENGFLSEILRQEGYACYAVGKWHLTPEDETHMAAPRNTWPLGRGFDRWYGFHGGETHQFVPALFCDNHSVTPPRSLDEGYHLSADLVDQAVGFLSDLRAVDDRRPFFLYFCTGACHSPHHAPRSWIDAERGRFDGGWDAWREATFARQREMGIVPEGTELAPRPPWVPAWENLSEDERRVAARFMECFAAYLAYTDAQLGRLFAFLEDLGERENTLVLVVSDNGASAEGGPTGSINDMRLSNLDPAPTSEMLARLEEIGGPSTHNNYPWGWTMAGNTPFKRWKREVHHGGVADPCIVSWPARLRGLAGSIRRQFVHAIDVLPTVLELAGIELPGTVDYVPQTPVDGTSFAYLLEEGADEAPERHHTQYFEMFGSRAIYHRGWKAVTFKPVGPLYGDGLEPNAPFDEDPWELYDLRSDLSECHDLAAEHPGKVEELERLWWEEAERNQVLPLDNRVLHSLANPPPNRFRDRTRFRYFAGASTVPEPVAINVRNRSHTIRVLLEVPAGSDPEGTLLALGSVLGGWTFHVHRGRLRYLHNLYGKELHVVEATRALGSGRHEVVLDFRPTEGLGGEATITQDGEVVAQGPIERCTPTGFTGTGVGLTCGYEWGPAIGADYRAPFPFTGTLLKVEAEVFGPPFRDPIAELDAIMSEQ